MKSSTVSKILIIRFSSFGDVTQCLSVPAVLKKHFPQAPIHWVIRQDMAELLKGHPDISQVWPYQRQQGLMGLLSLGLQLRQEGFSHVYDAHNNLRSRILTLILRSRWSDQPVLLRRSLRRWKRFLLFRFRLNYFKMPFSGQRDLIEPLQAWGIPFVLPAAPQLFLSGNEKQSVKSLLPNSFVALAPSAAFELKRWPVEHWKKLIINMKSEKFVLLGGPQDHFLEELRKVAPERVTNLAGKTNLKESAAVVASAKALVSNDTGLLHVGEQLGCPTIALMGPAPFGFPSRSSTRILELPLACRPCSKHGQGPCRNPVFQQCLREILPEQVQNNLQEILREAL